MDHVQHGGDSPSLKFHSVQLLSAQHVARHSSARVMGAPIEVYGVAVRPGHLDPARLLGKLLALHHVDSIGNVIVIIIL